MEQQVVVDQSQVEVEHHVDLNHQSARAALAVSLSRTYSCADALISIYACRSTNASQCTSCCTADIAIRIAPGPTYKNEGRQAVQVHDTWLPTSGNWRERLL